jgi:DNA-binding transcriptional LysR family regulator
MQSLRGILSFTRAAELGSFAAAARELGVSPVAVSQSISRLEASLGVRLFARSTRALRLTAEGQAFLDQCREPLAQLARAVDEIGAESRAPSGRVRASVISPLAYLYLVQRLPDFFRRYPGVLLELELSEDASPLIPKRCDVGVRVGALDDAAFVARPLGPMRLLLCASPGYLAQHGVPRDVAALARHAGLLLHIPGKEHPTPFIMQTRLDGARAVRMVMPEPRLACNDFRALHAACVDGLGIAQLPQPVALASLREGALKTVLAEHMVEGWQLFIHYPSRKHLPARVRVFVDFCIEQFGGHPDLGADVSAHAAS